MDQVLGHELIKQKIQTMIAADRVPSCLIFSGPSGVGKKQLAWSMAQDMLCEQGRGTACGHCGACLRTASLQSESVLYIEPKSQQIKIEQARQVLQFLNLMSVSEKRVIIINDAHMLNPQASNALLKSIEEPPPGVYFVLVVQTLSSLLPTIVSRSQVIRFQPLEDRVVKDITGAEDWIINASQGRVDQVQKLMDQDVSKELRQVAFEFWQKFVNDQGEEFIFHQLDQISDREKSLTTLLFWKQIIRDAIVAVIDDSKCIHADQLALIKSLSQLGYPRLDRLQQLISNAEVDIRSNVDRKLCFENFYMHSQEVV